MASHGEFNPRTRLKVNKRSSKELWLCLRFSHLSLNSLSLDVNSSQACAVSEHNKVWQCNHAAEQLGIRNTMSISHALMLHDALGLAERDVFAEQQSLQKLSHWAYRYSSMVALYNDHCLNVEIGKSISLFNNLEQLINLIKTDLDDMKITFSSGISQTPKLAYALSFTPTSNTTSIRANKNAIGAIEITHLGIHKKTKAKLHHCGFSTLADLRSITTAELGQRFGQDFVNYLDQLEGRKPDPQISTKPAENFEACVDFAEPISNLQWIEQQIERLLSDLYKFIATRQLLCCSFTWRFFHENNHLLETVHIQMSGKQNSLASMLELSQLRLAQLNLSWEFSSIELSSKHLYLKKLFNDDLFDPKPDLEQFNQLIDKLSSRLGHTALFRLNHSIEQLPEMANTRQQVNELSPSYTSEIGYEREKAQKEREKAQKKCEQTQKPQPLWLLPTPQYLSKHDNKPFYKGPLNFINGPDRISSHWWSKLQSRDYYLARQNNGRLLWLYFDRDKRNWYLHGLFA